MHPSNSRTGSRHSRNVTASTATGLQLVQRRHLVRRSDVAPAPSWVGRALVKITLQIIGQHSMRPIIIGQPQ